MPALFRSLAEVLEKVGQTRSRIQMISLASTYLKTLNEDELAPAVSMILGRAFPKWSQKTLDISWTTISDILQRVTGNDWTAFSDEFRKTGDIGSASMAVFEQSRLRRQAVLFEQPLSIQEVCRSLEAITDAEGSGSKAKKERLLTALLSQATPVEAKYLVKIFTGEMRTGFQEGLMEQTIAKAFDAPLAAVQRASMALGDVSEVVTILKADGVAALEKVGFAPFRPVKLMLAQVADDVSAALAEHGGETAFEYKYDGARVQIHKQQSTVNIFSRRLTEVTQSLPEIVDLIKANVKAEQAILEGEVVAVNSDGTPIPFQHLMRRFKRIHQIASEAEKIPLKLYLFDILYLNGESQIHAPYLERRKLLAEIAGDIPLTTQIVTSNLEEVETFLKLSIAAGHEGLMAKKPDNPYTPGTRGKNWLKIKVTLEPLDVVITAAEWGYGRRHNWLSDYYLAARDEETGQFLEIGKTFKGLTDAEISDLTKRLKNLAINEGSYRVDVLPKIVVEVAYNEIQLSPKYPSQMALRFARITRIRDDKTPEQADTIQRVKTIYEQQFSKKARYKRI
jgi:DNA ligase 1